MAYGPRLYARAMVAVAAECAEVEVMAWWLVPELELELELELGSELEAEAEACQWSWYG